MVLADHFRTDASLDAAPVVRSSDVENSLASPSSPTVPLHFSPSPPPPPPPRSPPLFSPLWQSTSSSPSCSQYQGSNRVHVQEEADRPAAVSLPQRKLTKRRPSLRGDGGGSRHAYSVSAPGEVLCQWSPDADVERSAAQRGRESSRERQRGRDEGKDVVGKRSKSLLRIRGKGEGGGTYKKAVAVEMKRKAASVDGHTTWNDEQENEGQEDFLPPLRPPSPFWAGSFGKVR